MKPWCNKFLKAFKYDSCVEADKQELFEIWDILFYGRGVIPGELPVMASNILWPKCSWPHRTMLAWILWAGSSKEEQSYYWICNLHFSVNMSLSCFHVGIFLIRSLCLWKQLGHQDFRNIVGTLAKFYISFNSRYTRPETVCAPFCFTFC